MLSKDTNSLRYEMLKENINPYIMDAIITRNVTIDRPEEDWMNNEGRAVVKLNKIDTKKKTILVAGGCGFIGSNLCQSLIDEGNIVICLDNLFTGSMVNVKHLMGNDNFYFIKHDIINPVKISGSIDEIYNMACPASPSKYQIDPIYTSKVNL